MTHKSTLNSLDYLLETMQALRAPNGCPWDAEQTPESLAPYILEEACELIDAIEEGSTELILDELGDLLLQVVFQAQIFREREQFDFHDVARGIADKLVRRHPHVFASSGLSLHTKELDQQWDEIKRSEATHNKTCLADHLPRQLPALQRAQKLISKTHRLGRQGELPETGADALKAGTGPTDGNKDGTLDEDILGQALFDLVRTAFENGLDAETALRKATRRAIKKMDHK